MLLPVLKAAMIVPCFGQIYMAVAVQAEHANKTVQYAALLTLL